MKLLSDTYQEEQNIEELKNSCEDFLKWYSGDLEDNDLDLITDNMKFDISKIRKDLNKHIEAVRWLYQYLK